MKDEEFIQVVRRHRPNALVPLIAKIASQRIDPDTCFRLRQRGFGVPWALAEITRTSIAYSNEYRGNASERDVARCSDAYADLDDPELVEGYQGPLAGFFLRLCEQLEYQLPLLNEMARSIAIFGRTEPVRETKVIRPGWDEELLGSDLVTFVAAGQMLHIAARPNEGRFNPRWMDQQKFSFVREVTDPDALRAAWSRTYVIDARDLAALNGRPAASPWRRFAHNPLLSRPIVSGLHDDWLIPVPGLVVRRLSPLGLYYSGIDHFGKAFADDLGYLFEPYIGAQLRLLEAAHVESGFTYGSDNRETVDFIVTLPEVVVLVEVKSVRPTAPVRAGDEGAESELRRMLNKGVHQIELADRLIEERHPAFSHVATDRPRIGLVITLEDFHVLNSGFHRSILGRQRPELPIGIASAGHIEHWVTVIDKTPGTVVLEAVSEPVTELGDTSRGVALKQALEGCRHRRNELINAAWASGPWEQLRVPEG